MAQQTNHIGDTNKMVTAVEWLINELESEAITDYSFAQAHKLITLDVYIFNKLIAQAKQMEKEQIKIAFYKGLFGDMKLEQEDRTIAEIYYNNTYGSNNKI